MIIMGSFSFHGHYEKFQFQIIFESREIGYFLYKKGDNLKFNMTREINQIISYTFFASYAVKIPFQQEFSIEIFLKNSHFLSVFYK